MTEHDVPTAACATLWLDTSNETTTRRGECLEDCATIAFERTPESETRCVAPAQHVATAVLDRAQLIAAIDHHATDAMEPPLGRELRARRAILRGVATHTLALFTGAALSVALLSVPRAQPATALEKAPAAQARSEDLPAPIDTRAPARPEPDAAAPSSIAQASQNRAVDALARGDYAAARIEYEALAGEHPNDAALSAVAALLAARNAGRCTEKDGSCAR